MQILCKKLFNMSSVSFADLVIDKLLSFSSKMKNNPFNQSSSLCLMADNPNIYYNNIELMADLIGSGDFPLDVNTYDSVQRNSVEYPLIKNFGGSDLRKNSFNFSPHLFGLLHDSVRYLTNQSDMLLPSQNKLSIAKVLSDLFDFQPPAKQNKNPQLQPDPVIENPIYPVHEPVIQMSVTVKNKSDVKINPVIRNSKLNPPNDVNLNLELANRKAKELQKRSKKRRRRQKKVKPNDCSSRSSKVKDSLYGCLSTPPIFSHESFSSSNCQTDSRYLISVNQQSENMTKSVISSFVISVESVSDDDSEWDSYNESDIFNEAVDFEFGGLVVTNLCVPNSYYPSHSFNVECCVTTIDRDEEANEIAKIRAMLYKVNKKWNESTKSLKKGSRVPSKVSFATEDKLVEVFPVDICDRKGEWEIYASERLRFKRRIDELHDIISPCFSPEHRLNVYNNLFQSSL